MPDGTRPDPLLSLDALPRLPSLPMIKALPWAYHPEGFMARMLEWAERYRDPGAFVVPMPRDRSPIFVGNVALAEDLIDEARFEKVLEGPVANIREFTGDGLFTARSDEASWHRAHRILTPGFSAPSMDRYHPAMAHALEALIAHMQRSDGPIDVVSDMTKLTLDTISLAGFDYDFASFQARELHPFLRSLARALQESIDALMRPPLLAPLWAARRARYRDDVQAMFSLVDRVIAERKPKPRERWPKDFLSLMLDAVDPKTGERLSDENIRYQILTFLIAGHETTAGLLSFALFQLASDRALFARVRREVDEVLGDGTIPGMKQIGELELVRRVLSEALRLWPTVPAVTRAPKVDTNMGRFLVPAGQPLGLLLHALHRDPAAWPDPARFDPDRFLPEAVKTRSPAAYKPFGIGKRACTGKHFALVEATMCIAALVRTFDFAHPGKLALMPTLSPKPKEFRLRVRPRRG